MPVALLGLRRAVRQAWAVVSGPVVLFYDTFTGADGTLLTAHTPDIDTVGGGWAEYKYGAGTANFTIQSNQCHMAAGAAQNAYHCAAQTNAADVVITADLTNNASASTSLSILGRIVNTSALSAWRGVLASATMLLQEVNAGVFTTRVNGGAVLSSQTYACTMTLSGTAIEFKNSAATLNYTSSQHQTNTRHGLLAVVNVGSVDFIADDFQVVTA